MLDCVEDMKDQAFNRGELKAFQVFLKQIIVVINQLLYEYWLKSCQHIADNEESFFSKFTILGSHQLNDELED